MNIIVTGGGGFLGGYVVDQFKLDGHTVKTLDILFRHPHAGLTLDVTNFESVKETLKHIEPEIVVHLAGMTGSSGKGGGAESLKDPFNYFNVNMNGALNVYEASRQLDISKVICMSSFSPYGYASSPINEQTPLIPSNPYGGSKLCVEEIAKIYSNNYGIKSTIFRSPLICGEGQSEMNALREFVSCALNDSPIVIFGDGKHVREFVHPIDVASAFSSGISFMSRMKSQYEIFVLGNKPIRMIDLAELIVKRVGKGEIQIKPATSQAFDQYSDFSKAIDLLRWYPKISLDEIVERVISDISAKLDTTRDQGENISNTIQGD